MLDKEIDIHPEDETSSTMKCHEAFPNDVEIKDCAKHQRMSVIQPSNVPASNLFPSAKSSGLGQSCCGPFDLSSDDEEYIMPKSMAGMTPGRRGHAARLVTCGNARFDPTA